MIANNHDLDPEEIAERLKQQQHESEKDAQWLMAEERMLVCIVISNMYLKIHACTRVVPESRRLFL